MRKYIILSILLFVSLGLNLFLFKKTFSKQEKTLQTPQEQKYKFTNPLKKAVIDSNLEDNIAILHYAKLKPKLEEEIKEYYGGKNIAIFLQDIHTGAWLGINEKEGFTPASLLKIPILMAVLKKVDRDEIKLTDTIILNTEDLDKNAGQLYQKGTGAKISIWDLCKIMILSSDNTAKNALKRQLLDEELNAVFTHVGIPNPYLIQNGQKVSPRGYIRLLKSLYFSTFLSPALSEKALDLTTDTQMENLISAGVPPEIQVAHKFGERPDGISDCGIIYEPKNPYYLCIMTKDLETPEAKKLITNLSKIIYDFVAEKKTN